MSQPFTTAAPQPKQNQGQPLPRVDARLKVTGEARYAADAPLTNVAYAVMVTSSIAAGRVSKLRLDAARKVAGVLDVLSYGDADGIKPLEFGNSGSTSIRPLSDTKIWHDGQIVALVVGNSYEAARQGAYAIEAEYAPSPASASFGSPGVEVIAGAGATEQFKEDPKAGDFDGAYAAAPIKLDERYSTPTQHHNPIELFSTTAAWEDDRLTIWEPTQNVYGAKGLIAKQLDIDPAKVRVISQYIGGGFGSKGQITPRTAIVALAAKKLGRPVRCVVTRMQGFTTQTYRAETQQRIRMGATPDGKITAFSHHGDEVSSRADNYLVGGTQTTTRLYGYGAVDSKVQIVKADRQTPGYMRSPPELPYVYALESAMDEMAEKLKMDPVEFRRVNDTMKEPIKGKPFTSRSLMKCFDEASARFDWKARNPAVGSMRDGEWLIGMGCASAVYPTHTAAATARIRLSPNGQASVQTAAHEIGTGIRTILAQMTAERLGLDPSGVQVEAGDSMLPPAPVAGGSNSTASLMSTVLKGCNAIRDKLFAAVVAKKDGPLSGRKPEELDIANGVITARDGARLKLDQAFEALGMGVIEEYAEFIPEGAPIDSAQKLYGGKTTMRGGSEAPKMMFAFGAEFVEVRINARTREVRVPRIVGAFAAGRIMNTRTAHSQLMGGMIWGISSALHEATEVDARNARYVNRDLAEYLMPVHADVNQVDVIMVPEVDHEVNPAGVKGLGELGNVGTAAAIANAVYHATGMRVRDLPIRIESVLST